MTEIQRISVIGLTKLTVIRIHRVPFTLYIKQPLFILENIEIGIPWLWIISKTDYL